MKFVTTAFTALAVSLAIARVDAFVRLSPENDPDGSRHLTEEPHDHSTKNVRRTSYFPKAKVPKKAAKGKHKVSGKSKGWIPHPPVDGKGKGGHTSSKGPPAHSSKSKTPPVPSCTKIPVYFTWEDLRRTEVKGTDGKGTSNAPFYSLQSGALLGYYSEWYNFLSGSECIGTSSYSFGDVSPFKSQIDLGFTCMGDSNSITGGNGRYGCAEGYERFLFSDASVIASELIICGSLCPPPPNVH